MQTLTNETTTEDEGNESDVAKSGKGIFLSAITVATIIGNSLSLLALIVTKKWNTRYLIVNLATTDLLLGLMVMPFSTISAIKNRWLFNRYLCDAQGSLGFLLCQVSVLTITCVSMERYILFQHASTHFKWMKSNSKLMLWVVIVTWFYGGMWTFLAWQIPQFSYQRELLNCAVVWRNNFHFTISCGVITMVIPISLILCCNFRVTIKVRKTLKKINLSRARSESVAMKRSIAEVKISRMLLAVTVAFLLCWTPYSLAGLSYLISECKWPKQFYVASVISCLLNSAINPVLYGTFDRRCRHALAHIFCKRMLRKPTNRTVIRLKGSCCGPTKQRAQQVIQRNKDESI
ncbi:histamine H2 receptor-like [Xenia sp. Carnegie-2017]|uniref:histamine H2 receptor-like n=1 Tax=Xenia sp. Carnegie-2017 TaxID=2897299 RepID=UPI001F03FF18|nr:histamine H2 receptor-like [Xenia sp. Carnegie-2017]